MTADSLVQMLAVIGGGVVGGLGLGLLAQLLARALTTKRLPPWSVLLVRVLSGVICAWIVHLGLSSKDAWRIGWPGGGGAGSGSRQGAAEKGVEVGKKDGDGKKNSSATKTTAGEMMRIEVLGNAALLESDIQAERWYHIETEQGWQLLTFAEIQNAIKKRQQEQPPLRRIEMVLYKDSPEEHVQRVHQLRLWASGLNGGNMIIKTSKSNRSASGK